MTKLYENLTFPEANFCFLIYCFVRELGRIHCLFYIYSKYTQEICDLLLWAGWFGILITPIKLNHWREMHFRQ